MRIYLSYLWPRRFHLAYHCLLLWLPLLQNGNVASTTAAFASVRRMPLHQANFGALPPTLCCFCHVCGHQKRRSRAGSFVQKPRHKSNPKYGHLAACRLAGPCQRQDGIRWSPCARLSIVSVWPLCLLLMTPVSSSIRQSVCLCM